ncbi:unnamed protein product [Echinostoma caproni]|uniref:Uncharacterized protein n=1 Tax=Echinostoma caproni TaxID=27848 RepID=A0A3P8LDB5_9TREM|nr:unnamed protein product [Echinostoma caproni]
MPRFSEQLPPHPRRVKQIKKAKPPGTLPYTDRRKPKRAQEPKPQMVSDGKEPFQNETPVEMKLTGVYGLPVSLLTSLNMRATS